RKMTSLTGIAALNKLEVLEIDNCKDVDSISEALSLSRLKNLFLLNTGDLDTIRGIENLTELEQLVFDESTNIVDGDLSSILHLKKLKKIAFQNRKHYTHRREDFGTLYF